MNEELTTFAYDLSNVTVDYIMYDNSLDDGEFEIWDSRLNKKTPLEGSFFEIILARKDDRSKRGKVIIYPFFFEDKSKAGKVSFLNDSFYSDELVSVLSDLGFKTDTL